MLVLTVMLIEVESELRSVLFGGTAFSIGQICIARKSGFLSKPTRIAQAVIDFFHTQRLYSSFLFPTSAFSSTV